MTRGELIGFIDDEIVAEGGRADACKHDIPKYLCRQNIEMLKQLRKIIEQQEKPKVTREWVEKWARDLSVYPTYDKRSVRLLKSMLSELGVEVEDGN